MATDIPDFSELDDVFQLRIRKGELPEFDLVDHLNWRYRLRPWRRFSVRQFYFWHKTLYTRDDGALMWLPELMKHDNQTQAVGRRHFLTKECRITKRAADRLDEGPLIDENAQTVVVPETRKLRRAREFIKEHSAVLIIGAIFTAVGVVFTIIFAA